MTPRFIALAALYFTLLAAVAVPLGRYLARVFAGENRATARVLGPVERWVYRLAGVDPAQEHDWRQYALAALSFSALTQTISYVVMRLQGRLPLNPTGVGDVPPWLAFNTATSFTTNTDWQSYGGETTMSHVSQAVALTSQNFFSAAVGLCVAVALLRGLSRKETDALGNFWVDLVRAHLYVLVPLCAVYALFLVAQGVVQTWSGPAHWTTLDGTAQSLLRGPVASQEAIKLLGTNGGGFFNANSAHPWENPTALTNFVEMFSIFAIPAALCVTLGEMTGNRRHGWAVFATMTLLAVMGAAAVAHFEQSGNPVLAREGVSQVASALHPGGNMEGKELRFGIADTALFAAVTTDASCGAVNAMHDSFTPLGGLIPTLDMQLGEVVFGGVGTGLYGMLVYILVAVFLAGLMVGRTPEYLGKKIDSRDVRLASLYVLVPAFSILLFTALATIDNAVDAMRAGASDYLAKPFTPAQVLHAVEKVLSQARVRGELAELERAGGRGVRPRFDTHNPAMQQCLSIATRAAATDATVLLLGETGTGKGYLARHLHALSPRRERPFVTFNCAVVAATLVESELFGHAKGAFTGADRARVGHVEAAGNGTLFLDEVGDLPREAQGKLLRLLEEREYVRVGETAPRRSDARLVAATHRDLKAAVAAGTFREDLYFRLNVVSATLPPLRDRREDLVDLAALAVADLGAQHRRGALTLAPATRAALVAYRWPGNLRELSNVIERAVILCEGDTLTPDLLPEEMRAAAPVEHVVGDDSLEAAERRHIADVLARSASLDAAAKALGVDPSTLYRKRERYGLR